MKKMCIRDRKKAGGMAISIRNNELYTKEWQCRISIPTQSPTYLCLLYT